MPRRCNGEGTIYRRRDGRFAAAVSLDGGRRKYVYGRTREETARKLVDLLKTKQDGIPIPTERMGVKALYSFSTCRTLASFLRALLVEGQWCDLAQGLMGSVGVVDVLPFAKEFADLGEGGGGGEAVVELLLVGALGAFDVAVELG